MATIATVPPQPPPSRSFVFINDTSPNDAKSKSKRKLVRAQAARGPHSNTLNGAAKSDRNLQNTLSKHQQSKKAKRGNATTTIPLNVVGLEDIGPSPPPEKVIEKPKAQQVVVKVKDKGVKPAAQRPGTLTHESSQSSTDNVPPHNAPAQCIPPLQTAGYMEDEDSYSSETSTKPNVPKNPGTGWAAPFHHIQRAEPNRPYIPMLMDHYIKKLAIDIPELDLGEPFILRKRWFPLVITSPATLYTTLLTAASHYTVSNKLLTGYPTPSSPSTKRILLGLKQSALTSINKLIRETPPNTGVSDTIIGAVAKMASYEAMFGSESLYHTHMRGLQNMIRQKGGLTGLGLGGLLMRMVLWIDINSAFILGCKTYFVTDMPLAGHIAHQIEPNPAEYCGVFFGPCTEGGTPVLPQ